MGLSHDPPASKRTFCLPSGKERLSRGEAKSTAKRQRGAGNLQAYKCDACKGWHVGNQRRFKDGS